jgi:hypothetical protein
MKNTEKIMFQLRDLILSLDHEEAVAFATEVCYLASIETGESCLEAQRILFTAALEVTNYHEGGGVYEDSLNMEVSAVIN